jgi:hypothetical protein
MLATTSVSPRQGLAGSRRTDWERIVVPTVKNTAARRSACGFALVLFAVVVPPAAAKTMYDGDDARGKLDAQATAYTSSTFPARLHFRATMYERWTLRQCLRANQLEGGCYILFVLDTKGRDTWGRRIRDIDYFFRWIPGRCDLFEESLTTNFAGHGVPRKGPRSALCSIRRSKIESTKKIRWYVLTQWADYDEGWYSGDTAPDRGWYGH